MAKAKTDKEMVTTSIYIDKELLEQLRYASGRVGVSTVLSKLGKMWLDKDVVISIEPIEEKR